MNDPDLHLHLPAVPESVTVVRQALGGLADTLGWSEDFEADVELAVSEACTNVVVHAYGDASGPLDVSVWLGEEELTLAIDDEGSGMSPSLAGRRTSLGIGLPLMSALSDRIEFASRNNGSTRMSLHFKLDRSSGE